MESPNSGSLLFLAFWEMPAMDSPSTCRTHHAPVRDKLPFLLHAPRLRAHCASSTGVETPFVFPPHHSQTSLSSPKRPPPAQGSPWSSP